MMLEKLKKRVVREAPPSGVYGFLNEKAPDGSEYIKSKFQDLPISRQTLAGLTKCDYHIMTPVQRAALPHALALRDILGTATTGSGKTLSFLIPTLELLLREQWSQMDGLGVLIIEPTRELALQVFEVLQKIGERHNFSAGLIIGGHNVEEERARISTMNILIATPGRLRQHLQETPYFATENLRLLVLDEVDRILDLGFSESINAILSYLPGNRQTLLFSATLSRGIQELARLSLKTPEFINIYSKSESDQVGTPSQLLQSYTVVPIGEKLNLIWSFVKTHLKSRTLVFFSSGKQVRYAYELFKHLRPGQPVMEIHGKQRQSKRTYNYFRFKKEPAGVMFCTDVLSRGIDFPAVDWVIQADCPEDVATYIHRVGRTARYKSKGVAMLLLAPHETKFAETLQANGVEVKKAKFTIKRRIEGFARDFNYRREDIKHLAEKYFSNYLKSVHLNPNKEIFDVSKINLDELAASVGLRTTPRISFTDALAAPAAPKVSKLAKLKAKIAARKLAARNGAEANAEAQVEVEEQKPAKARILLKKRIKHHMRLATY